MLLEQLRKEVLEANLELVRHRLVIYTWGNASGIDRETGLVVIKPSGLAYDGMRAEHMVVTDLEGRVVEGDLRPSSDLATHTLLYKSFPSVGGVVHTHSEYATSFAQANLPIPALGTTHADYFHGPVPVTEQLSESAIAGDYVEATGHAIVARFRGERGGDAIDPLATPACLVAGHAPFVWGRTVGDAAHHAVVLEAVARMAFRTRWLNANVPGISQALLDRHYFRKHGAQATYGQE